MSESGNLLIEEENLSVSGVESLEELHKNDSLEGLTLLIQKQKLEQLKDNTHKEFTELKDRQKQVRELHNVQKAIHKVTQDDGSFLLNDELKDLLLKAKEFGIEADSEKTNFSKEERERLLDSLGMTISDLKIQNDMQMQQVQRLTNERYETYQMTRAILKPLDEAKRRLAAEIKGR